MITRRLWARVCSILLLAPQLFAAPQIDCLAPVHDFGEADSGTVVTNAFLLGNVGDEPLHIKRVYSSCGCTVPQLPSDVIEPGDVMELTAVLSLRGRMGAQHTRIWIESNDPARLRYELILRGEAVRGLVIRPEALHLGRYPAGTEIRRYIDISAGSQSVRLLEVATSDPAISARVQEFEAGQRYRLLVTLPDDLPPGAIHAAVRVVTDHATKSEIIIPIQGDVTGPILTPVDRVESELKIGHNIGVR